MENKLTDNEIIKALECCVKTEYISGCAECEMFAFDCKDKLIEYALDLINRQKAEIEKLKDFRKVGFFNLLGNCLVYSKNLKDYNDMRKGLKSEAIKEFAERLIKEYENIDGQYVDRVMLDIIDNLVKEMEDKNG